MFKYMYNLTIQLHELYMTLLEHQLDFFFPPKLHALSTSMQPVSNLSSL